ncbi:MAG TPA: hypothetical protein VK465_19030 [Fibrobacteria bacterium]|nr:hypothetical protein [Fibrobacteria bacterium]
MDKPREDSSSLSGMGIRQALDALGINIAEPAMETFVPATPIGSFTSRIIRYTIGRGLERITRETTCDMLAVELGAFLAQPDTVLIGIDGINGFTCGPTQDELRMFAVPLGAIERKQGVS